MSRRQARELVLQALFHLDFNSLEELNDVEKAQDTAFEMAVDEFGSDLSEDEQKAQLTKKDRAFAQKLLQGTREKIGEIDNIITDNSREWKLQRMAGIDRNLLRMAVFELCFDDERLNSGIIINEAVELAKKYGTDDSGRFINGILGSISRTQA